MGYGNVRRILVDWQNGGNDVFDRVSLYVNDVLGHDAMYIFASIDAAVPPLYMFERIMEQRYRDGLT